MMPDANPVVSVLMTAYNRQDFIASSIESVLSSTLHDFELLVVDDASSDGTVGIAREYAKKDKRISVYVNEKNLGDYPNRNKAASLARGKYLKYLDSDDIIYPHGLEVMVTSMEKFPEAGYGLCSNSDPQFPYPVCISPHQTYLEHFYGYDHFGRAPGSAILKREAFQKVGGFSGERMIGDSDLWYRLSFEYPLVKLPRDLIWDRVHPGQESQSEYAKKYEQLKKKVMDTMLTDKKCPLSREEVSRIYRLQKSLGLKKWITQWLRN